MTTCIVGLLLTVFGVGIKPLHARTTDPVMIKDVEPGTLDYGGYFLVAADNLVYFTANDGAHGRELWKSDGTAEGTVLVKDIYSGTSDSLSGSQMPVVSNGYLYFGANDGTHNYELWKTDGTEAGTVMVKDIRAGGLSSSPYYFGVLNDTIYFAANNGTHGRELWKTDGTEAGTVMVKDIVSGSGSSNPLGFVEFNNALYFDATNGTNGREVWKTDGTEAGTVMVKDIRPGSGSGLENIFSIHAEVFNNALYFKANDGVNSEQLWKTDGTEAGTTLFKVINPTGESDVWGSAVYKKHLYFGADDGINGSEVWKTDGTEAGTVMVKNINAQGPSYPYDFVEFDDQLFFGAADGVNYDNAELWKSDGTEAGTVLAWDFDPDSLTEYGGYYKSVVSNNTLFLLVDGGQGIELWKIEMDNADPGDVEVGLGKDSKRSPGEKTFKVRNREVKLYFSANDTNGVEKIKVSEHKDFRGSSWRDYDGNIKIKLSKGDETKTIYFKFKDEAGNTTKVYEQKIQLDTTPPEFAITTVGLLDYEEEIKKATGKKLYYTGQSVVISGNAPDADEVRLVVANDTKFKTPVDGDQFEFPPYIFGTGIYEVVLIAEDAHGQMSMEEFTLVIDPTGSAFPSSLQTSKQ